MDGLQCGLSLFVRADALAGRALLRLAARRALQLAGAPLVPGGRRQHHRPGAALEGRVRVAADHTVALALPAARARRLAAARAPARAAAHRVLLLGRARRRPRRRLLVLRLLLDVLLLLLLRCTAFCSTDAVAGAAAPTAVDAVEATAVVAEAASTASVSCGAAGAPVEIVVAVCWQQLPQSWRSCRRRAGRTNRRRPPSRSRGQCRWRSSGGGAVEPDSPIALRNLLRRVKLIFRNVPTCERCGAAAVLLLSW